MPSGQPRAGLRHCVLSLRQRFHASTLTYYADFKPLGSSSVQLRWRLALGDDSCRHPPSLNGVELISSSQSRIAGHQPTAPRRITITLGLLPFIIDQTCQGSRPSRHGDGQGDGLSGSVRSRLVSQWEQLCEEACMHHRLVWRRRVRAAWRDGPLLLLLPSIFCLMASWLSV